MSSVVLENVNKSFGGIQALTDVSFTVNEGEIYGIIGPNGAGKTTLINLMSGLYRGYEGSIRVANEEISKLKTYQISRLGVSRTFQNIRLFSELTVLDNIIVSLKDVTPYPIRSLVNNLNPRYRKRLVEQAEYYLEFMGIADKRNLPATALSYGDQRRLEIARALAVQPKIIFLDEPAAGMNEKETGDLAADIAKLHNMVPTIILVEHDMSFIKEVTKRVLVLDFGKKLIEGAPSDVLNDSRVIEAYLGRD